MLPFSFQFRAGKRGMRKISVKVTINRKMFTENAIRNACRNASGDVCLPRTLKKTVPMTATPIAKDTC